MSHIQLSSPAKRKKSEHVAAESIMDVATPVQQNFASETPRSLDFNFSLENTPTFPLMQLPVPSSKDWTPNMRSAETMHVSDPIFSETPYVPYPASEQAAGAAGTRNMGFSAGVLGRAAGNRRYEDMSLYSPLIGNFTDELLDPETESHLMRNREALVNKYASLHPLPLPPSDHTHRLDDLSRNSSSRLSLSSGSDSHSYEQPPSGRLSDSQEGSLGYRAAHSATPTLDTHQDPFQHIVGKKGFALPNAPNPSRTRRLSGIAAAAAAQEDMDLPSSQASDMSGLMAITAAAEQLPLSSTSNSLSTGAEGSQDVVPNAAHSPSSPIQRKRLKAKSPLRSFGSSTPASSAGSLSLFGQLQRASLTSSKGTANGETPSTMLSAEMLQLGLAKATDSKAISCNCKKSRCLKMYCDCFRLTEFCKAGCNCFDCANSVNYETQRQAAIKSITDRNPEAFKPRVVEDVLGKGHLTGCHCRKSACLKKYCECFTAKVPCMERCRCADCRNLPALYAHANAARSGTNSNANSQDGFSQQSQPLSISSQSLPPAGSTSSSFRKAATEQDRRRSRGAVKDGVSGSSDGLLSLVGGNGHSVAAILSERPLSEPSSLFQSAQQQMYSPSRPIKAFASSSSSAMRMESPPASPDHSSATVISMASPDASRMLKKKALSYAFNQSNQQAVSNGLELDLGAVYEDAPSSPVRAATDHSNSDAGAGALMSPSKLLELASYCEELEASNH